MIFILSANIPQKNLPQERGEGGGGVSDLHDSIWAVQSSGRAMWGRGGQEGFT